MATILAKLQGGDRRSIGKSAEAVLEVLQDPSLFAQLLQAMLHDDHLIRMRSADAVEKVSALHPEYLQPHRAWLFANLPRFVEQETRWHVAQMLPRFELDARQRAVAAATLIAYLHDASNIVRACALQALVELAESDAKLRARVRSAFAQAMSGGSAAVRARGRKLLRRYAWLAQPRAPVAESRHPA